MQERRRLHRGRTYLGARIAFNSRYSTLDCLVRNLSQDGARIVFSSAVPIPEVFDLMIHQKGESRRARLAWRDDMQAGIRFLPQFESDNVISLETSVRLSKLKAERDSLALRVAELSGSS